MSKTTLRTVDFVSSDCLALLTPARVEQLAPLKNSTLAMTGGTGFLGTWVLELVSTLNERFNFGTEVVAIARNIDAFKTQRPHLAAKPYFRFTKANVAYECELPRQTQWALHLAANRDRRQHTLAPVEIMTHIAQGTERFLRAADECPSLKMAANVTSGLVAGTQPLDLDRLGTEFYGPAPLNNVLYSYQEAKRYAELLGLAFRVANRLPLLTIRPFSFIGPYQKLESPWAVTSFLQDALRGRPIRVLGNGQTTRSYLYPSDAAFALLRMVTSGESGMTYNLGSPVAVTLETLAQAVADECSPKPEVRFSADPGQAGHVSRLVPDTSLCVEKLGLEVTVAFKEAIQKTMAWFRLSGEA